MKFTIFGQTPSKKSSQTMVTTKVGKMFVETWRDQLLVLLIELDEKKVFDLPQKEAYEASIAYFDNFIRELLKKERSETKNILLPNKKYMEWEKGAIYQLKAQKEKFNLQTIEEPVNVASVVYRLTKRRIDSLNMQQSIHDVLERAGIVSNDFLIETTDGSRRNLGVNKGEERAEIYITKADPF